MRVRLKDIAEELGVSVVTVSKVLRNHPDISEETKVRVRKRMEDLNYRPNLAARALVTGRTFMVGLVVPDLVHSFFAQTAKALSRELRKHGYSLVISSSMEDHELEQQEIEQLLNRRVDALVIASAQSTTESFRRIEEQKTPYVLIDRNFADFDTNFVGINDENAGLMATNHLIEVGCVRVAHIACPRVSTGLGRETGYRQSLREHGLQQIPALLINLEHGDEASDENGYRAMQTLLAASPRPDGVFCYNDPTALGAMMAILDEGLRIPEDIALVGCGNVHYAGYLRVPLTSVDQNSAGMGESAARIVLALMGAKNALPLQSVRLEPRLVVRQSTVRPQ